MTENKKVTLKVGDILSMSKNDNLKGTINHFKNGKPFNNQAVYWDMTEDYYYVNGVRYAREDIIIPDDNTAASNSVAVPESASGTVKIDVRPTEILSPSQPNMRVGGWVKCIKPYIGQFDNKDFEFIIDRWYPISSVKKRDYADNHQYSLEFAVYNLLNESVLGGISKDCIFTSVYFDCNNAMPYNPSDTYGFVIAQPAILTNSDIEKLKQNNWNSYTDELAKKMANANLIKVDIDVPNADRPVKVNNTTEDDCSNHSYWCMGKDTTSIGDIKEAMIKNTNWDELLLKEDESPIKAIYLTPEAWFWGHTNKIEQNADKNKSTNQPVEVNDMVNNPPHYNFGGIECIDAIKAQLGQDGFIAFLRGQIAKYNWRVLHKNNPLEDAKKIQYYTNLLVRELEAKQMEIK